MSKPIGPFGFVGGWNTKASAFTLPKDQMSDAQDVQVIYGDLAKRKGSKAINASVIAGAPAVHGIFDWQTNAGQRSLIVTAGTKFFKTNDLGSTLTDITGAVTITSGANNQHTFASLNNILVCCGGTTPDTPIQWTGAGNVTALAGAPPVGSICTMANNFVFISGIAANPSRVFWSNASDPGTWPAGSNIDFRFADGDKVTALSPFAQNLAIFKRRSIGILFTQQNIVSGTVTLAPLTEIVNGVGCTGSQALDRLPDGRIVFLGTDNHVYIFSGVSALEDISDPPPPQSNIQPTLDALNVTQLPNAVLRVYPTKNQIWLSVAVGSSTTNNVVYVYDYKTRAWQSPFTGILANVMCASIDTRATPSHPIIMVTGNYGGFVYEQDTGNTNAENADLHIDGWGTVSIQVAQEKAEFTPRSVVLPLEAQTAGQLQFGYGFNGFTTVNQTVVVPVSQGGATLGINFILGTSSLSGPATLRKIVNVMSNGKVFSMQMQFRNQYASQDFTVHPVLVSDEVMI